MLHAILAMLKPIILSAAGKEALKAILLWAAKLAVESSKTDADDRLLEAIEPFIRQM